MFYKFETMIISVHLPKTAGTSFKKALKDYFGEGCMDDYSDNIYSLDFAEHISKAVHDSREILDKDFSNLKCIHGHFLPLKYKALSEKMDLKFITWMRDPVERLLSQYYYWKNSVPGQFDTHHRKFLEEDWSVEKLCLHPKYKNMYSHYLYAFPVEKFEFIGITEFYEQDLQWLAQRYLDDYLPHYTENMTARDIKKTNIDSGLLKAIREFHKEDFDLYRKALQMRQSRMG